MPPKLRPFAHVLAVLIGTLSLAFLGLIWVPPLFSVLWIIFSIFAGFVGLVLLFGGSAGPGTARASPHRLTRSRHDQWITGVCGGIAEFLGWRPFAVRGLWILFSLFFMGIGGVVVYVIMGFVMPPPSRGGKFRLEDFRVQ